MQKRSYIRRAAWATTLLAGLGVAAVVAAPKDSGIDGIRPFGLGADQSSLTHQGHTVPSEKSQQSFDVPGVVDKVMVKEGQVVKAGDILAQQDIEPDQAHIEQLTLKANSMDEIEAEEASLAKAQSALKRKTKLFGQGAINEDEFDEAKLEVDVDIHKVSNAKNQHAMAAAELKEAVKRMEEKQLKAKVSGIVSEINTHEGELANNDTQHPAITVVKNDPVKVEVFIPVQQARQLAVKQKLMVQYAGEEAWEPAEIVFISPEAQADSYTQMVKLELPNPESKRASGLNVLVKLPDNLGKAAAARAGANP